MAKEDERLVSRDPTKPAGSQFSDGVHDELVHIIANEGIEGPPGQGPPGPGLVDAQPAGDGTSVQFYVAGEDGAEPLGDPIPVSIAYNSTVTHGTDPDADRPPVSVAVIWIGSVQPNQALAGDVWWDTSGIAPTITTTVLNGMNKDAAFSQMLYADGTTPIQWTKLTGTLPTGLTLSSLGNLFGTPSATGSFTFELEARNPFGAVTHSYTVTVGSAIGPTITTTSLGAFTSGVAYSLQLTASGSTPITYDTTSGSFPAGVTMNSAGLITGTPTTISSGSVTVRATNGVSTNSKVLAWSVSGIAPTITDTSLGSLWRGFALSKTLGATGSTPITFAKVAGSYPSGVTMNSSGVFSGTPDTVQSYSFDVQATNAYGDSAVVTFSGAVLESTPVVAESSLGAMNVGAAFSKQLTLVSGGPTITWTQTGTLPAGITWDATTHTLSGTPTTASSGSLTIRASNGTEYDDQVFSWTVVGLQYENAWHGSATTGNATVATSASAGAGLFAIVCSIGTQTDPSPASVAYDGGAMTKHGSTVNCGTYNVSYKTCINVYKLTGVSGGSKNVVVTPTAGTTSTSVYVVSAIGGATFGTLATTAVTNNKVLTQTLSSASGKLAFCVFFAPVSTAITGQDQTVIWTFGSNASTLQRADGASTVSFNAACNVNGWGAAAFDLAA